MGLGGLGGRGGWQARQFVCRRHKLVRPRDIQTRPDASRAPLICLASEQVHSSSSSSSSWFSWNSKSSSAGSSCPFSLCAGAGNFLISYDYSRICHLFTQTHGWGKGGWRGLCVKINGTLMRNSKLFFYVYIGIESEIYNFCWNFRHGFLIFYIKNLAIILLPKILT